MSGFRPGFELPPEDEATGTNEALNPGFELPGEEGRGERQLSAADLETGQISTLPPGEEPLGDDGEELRASFWSSPILWLLCLVVAVGGLQVYDLILSAFERGTVGGWCWCGGIGLALGLALMAIGREMRAVWRLRSTGRNRERAREITASGSGRDAIALCERMAAASTVVDQAALVAFRDQAKPHFSPEEVFSLYSRLVLSKVDERAKEIVLRRSRDSGIVVALSPVAWIDMAFFLARSLRMIREVAAAYGYRCGLWGRFALYRVIVRNLVYIGLADLATDMGADVLGAELLARLGASAGQGVAAGIYSTRLGYMAIKAVRPLPPAPGELSLASLRVRLVSDSVGILRRMAQGKGPTSRR
ncbi:MAG: TIGR01620 family protein [Succinivibrionaceae bacterium]|nr:TIGR01620 family protein [Succinivibrionaceae bacterium]